MRLPSLRGRSRPMAPPTAEAYGRHRRSPRRERTSTHATSRLTLTSALPDADPEEPPRDDDTRTSAVIVAVPLTFSAVTETPRVHCRDLPVAGRPADVLHSYHSRTPVVHHCRQLNGFAQRGQRRGARPDPDRQLRGMGELSGGRCGGTLTPPSRLEQGQSRQRGRQPDESSESDSPGSPEGDRGSRILTAGCSREVDSLLPRDQVSTPRTTPARNHPGGYHPELSGPELRPPRVPRLYGSDRGWGGRRRYRIRENFRGIGGARG